MKYSIITPAKNEAGNIEFTLESVVNQHLLPEEWIIIDDFSDDGMNKKIQPFAERYSWIKLISAQPRSFNDYSSRVVEIFNYGLTLLSTKVDVIVKLDGDVSFDTFFFQKILNEFSLRSKLGIASGLLTEKGIPEDLKYGDHNTRGATKCYRVTCFNDIGGLIPAISWDTVDNAAARAKGWDTRTLQIHFEHLKPEGARAGSYLKNHLRTGFSNGSIPYYLPYFILKVIKHTTDKPFLIGSLFQCAGYIKSRYLKNYRPFPDYACNQVILEQKKFIKSLLK
jgi:glycosyltransferase involved in cell wall biosynthesis